MRHKHAETIRKRKRFGSRLEVFPERIYNPSIVGSEIKHIRRDISDIKEVIDELKAGQVRLERLMEEMKGLARGAGKGLKVTGRKTENARTVSGTSQ